MPQRYSALDFPPHQRPIDCVPPVLTTLICVYYSVACLKGTQRWFSPHINDLFFCISFSYYNSTGASEKYVPTISPVISQDTPGGLCPMPDVRLEGFSPHRSSDRYYSSIISSGLPWPFLSILSSIPRFYIGWNQNPFTSRCLMPVAG